MDYREIGYKELSLISLGNEELSKIEEFKKKKNSGSNNRGYFFIVLGAVPFLLSLYQYSKIEQPDSGSIFLLCLVLIMHWMAAGVCFLNKIPKESSCIYAQYGIVNGKWSHGGGSKSGSRQYYLDVIFPDTMTRHKKIMCCYEQDYKRAQQGQKVLVFVLEKPRNKRVYGIIME